MTHCTVKNVITRGENNDEEKCITGCQKRGWERTNDFKCQLTLGQRRAMQGHQGERARRGAGQHGLWRDIPGPGKDLALCHWQCLDHDRMQLGQALAGPPEGRSRGHVGSEPNCGILSDLALVTPPEMDPKPLHREPSNGQCKVRCSMFPSSIFSSA